MRHIKSNPILLCCTLQILLQDCNQIAHWSDLYTIYTAMPVHKEVRKHCIEHHIRNLGTYTK